MSESEAQQTAQEDFVFTSTQDWFSFNIDLWRMLFPLVQSTNPRVLEIGSWEGRSAVFLLTELCGSDTDTGIVCIDHFDLMRTEAGRQRYSRVTHNLSLTKKRFRIIDEFSFPALVTLLNEEMTSAYPGYDWIYVDGSHEADDTFLDGELVWRLAKEGAIVIFDDYHWNKEPDSSIHHPKRGIDTFMTLHSGQFEVLSSPAQYQMILRKTSPMRIGFLNKRGTERGLDAALGYGINIAIATDSAYAMAAAVAINSAVSRTSDRITIYLVDLGLSEEEKRRLCQSVPDSHDATIIFVQLPCEDAMAEGSAAWAKIDMISALPVERVLYLDADVLVRADLRDLWRVDLGGKPIAAVTDIGFPMGHDEMPRRPYFNAGVLLIDLALVRKDVETLKALATNMRSSRYQDQDALNAYCDGSWLPLPVAWNAQGLGTYARLPSDDRKNIDMSGLVHPSIVHFTGPVNPKMEEVMNPFIQPCTAKPWGYAGAPGHPFKEEWWDVVEQTEWKGWRASQEYHTYRASEKAKAVADACSRFGQRIEKDLQKQL